TNASPARYIDISKRACNDTSIADSYRTTNLETSTTQHVSTSVSTPIWTSKVQHREPGVIKLYSRDWWMAVYSSVNGIKNHMIVLGTFLITIGLFLCTMGFRQWKLMLAVMGLLTFGFLGWIALANCRPENSYPNDTIFMIVVPILSVSLVTLFILSFGILHFTLLEYFLIFSTSFVGAYITFLGIDCLARKGYIARSEGVLNGNDHSRIEYTVSTIVYVFLGMTLVFFFASFVADKKGDPSKTESIKKETPQSEGGSEKSSEKGGEEGDEETDEQQEEATSSATTQSIVPTQPTSPSAPS
ncbi:hypothetical protein K501DRAFT_288324, partial [Backusella circina FSU 941]